jgi:polysaccharide export outer membrane protein
MDTDTDTVISPIMERRIHMMPRFLYTSFIAAVLLASLPELGVAQTNMPSYSGGGSSSAGSGRNSAEAPVAMQTASMLVASDITKLKLAPGFLVSLNVLDDTDFSGSFRIDEQGDLELPILGSIHVADETVSEARVQIQKRLRDDAILKDPQVILTLLEYTAPEVNIIGEVGRPGKYPLLFPLKLVDVLTLAGGPSATAGNEIQITRGSADTKPVIVHYSKGTDPKLIENVIIYPGDTIQIKRAGVVYVLGAVNRPGGYVMQEENTLNVLQVISLAGGTSASAKTGTIYLLRKNADGTVENIALPYQKMIQGKYANLQLRALDILYMPSSMMKAILANSGQAIISSAATSAVYMGIGR